MDERIPGMLAAAAAALALLAGGCARDPEIKTAAELYEEAVQLQESGDDIGAAEKYRELQASHPFGTYAQQAQLNLAHMYFDQDDFDESLQNAEQFLKDYPGHKNTDYALYMRAMSLLRASPSIANRVLGEEPYRRSQASLIKAHEAFNELRERYPLSPYSGDVDARIRYIVNEIARIELDIASYYLRRGAYSAAARRASYLVANYPDSTSGEDALAMLAASLQEIGASDAAADALAALEESFPQSPLIGPASQGADALTEAMKMEKPGDPFTRLIERR